MDDSQKKFKVIVKRIADEYKPEKIYLFGSRAWGRPRKDSDFDLFIIKKTRAKRFNRHLEVRGLIDGEIAADILVYTPKETERRLYLGDFFIEDIIKKGKILYESARQ
jgi:uncharacterized protein